MHAFTPKPLQFFQSFVFPKGNMAGEVLSKVTAKTSQLCPLLEMEAFGWKSPSPAAACIAPSSCLEVERQVKLRGALGAHFFCLSVVAMAMDQSSAFLWRQGGERAEGWGLQGSGLPALSPQNLASLGPSYHCANRRNWGRVWPAGLRPWASGSGCWCQRTGSVGWSCTVFVWYRRYACRHVINNHCIWILSRFVILVERCSRIWCSWCLVRWCVHSLVCVQYSVLIGIACIHAATHAAAQLQSSHVSNHGRGIEGLPPFAFSKVFAHLSADGLVDVLAERSVLCDPGMPKGLFTCVSLSRILFH